MLVVDDNATNRRILEEMLANWEMKPTCVSSAGKALEAIRKAHAQNQPFGLILTDVNMPEIDGFQLAEAVKQDPQLGSTVIMMLTSGDRPGDVARCEDLGAAAYLMKPIKQSELFDAIVSALGIISAEEEEHGRNGGLDQIPSLANSARGRQPGQSEAGGRRIGEMGACRQRRQQRPRSRRRGRRGGL